MKTCAQCGVEKSRTEFFARKASRDGLARLCKQCDAERLRKWKADNPEKRKAIYARWIKAHPDKVAANHKKWVRENPEKVAAKYRRWATAHPERARAWQVNNPEKAREKDRRWKRAHPDVLAANCSKRRTRRLQACPPWADLAAIKAKYEEAARLSRETGTKYHVDHIVPLRHPLMSGLHVEWNLRVIPAIVNLKKGNRFVVDSMGDPR